MWMILLVLKIYHFMYEKISHVRHFLKDGFEKKNVWSVTKKHLYACYKWNPAGVVSVK